MTSSIYDENDRAKVRHMKLRGKSIEEIARYTGYPRRWIENVRASSNMTRGRPITSAFDNRDGVPADDFMRFTKQTKRSSERLLERLRRAGA